MDPLAIHRVMFDFAWMSDPAAWLGVLTLATIEIVLGIDNLLFIAILSQKLPSKQRDKARYIGIGGALIIRLLLLTGAAYMVAMTAPLFTLAGIPISLRDMVMLGGGLFLLYKATVDLHARLEGDDGSAVVAVSRAGGHSLLLVSVQIMVLDAVFSVDAIITAVGMTEHVFIMMFAVCVAMLMMTLASKYVTDVVSRHPTLVILCLGFLLLIGFSLIMEALHFEVPKSYLYVAIGFSILIEVFNEIFRKNILRLGRTSSMQSREIAANLVLRLLGSGKTEVQSIKEAIVSRTGESVFNKSEKEMVSRVLTLSSLPVKAVMTSRTDTEMLKIDAPAEELIHAAMECSHSNLAVYRSGQKDVPMGYINRAELLSLALEQKVTSAGVQKLVRQPLYMPETVNILRALEEFREAKKYIAFVFDEYGIFKGLATLHDIMEEVAGGLPDQDEVPEVIRESSGVYWVEGEAVLKDVAAVTGFLVPRSKHYQTLAGFILDYLQRVPDNGEIIVMGSWKIEILKADQTSIEAVRLTFLKAPKKG